ncbi:HMG-box [Rhizopogon vinicolor AM-OR11-026]|uniref:HMG-box n=1 Tax=Rhizopogon vinicolor AM-OR11-026 TaxID=1314800 RepID=A0A1B7NGJ4_9AGAM|nr:HMG-box [Rhizopogon vinicolor AM-OR11-026]
MFNPHGVGIGPGLIGYSPWLFSQSPAFSDISLPSDDLYRSQSAPPCLEQGHNLFSSPLSLPPLLFDADVSLASSTNGKPPSKEHIPRPPNAFMLYRSHMLKSRGNADPEKRQQNLSRIAGQLWRGMSDEDRAVWHKKATEVHAAHYAKYPHYKFKPNRKGAKSGAKTLRDCGYHQKPTQQLIAGSSMGPVRRARSRRVYPKGFTREDLIGTLETQFPSSVSSSPGLSPLRLPPLLPVLSSETMCGNEHLNATPSHPQSQPQCANALGLELDVSRPPTPGLAEILSNLARDFDTF